MIYDDNLKTHMFYLCIDFTTCDNQRGNRSNRKGNTKNL